MALFDYNDFAALANELIQGSGRRVILQTLSAAPIDPLKPWNGPGAPAVAAQHVVIASFVPEANGLGFDSVPDDLLAKTDQVCLIAPNGSALEKANLIVDSDGSKWGVVWNRMLKPAEIPVLYAFGVKK